MRDRLFDHLQGRYRGRMFGRRRLAEFASVAARNRVEWPLSWHEFPERRNAWIRDDLRKLGWSEILIFLAMKVLLPLVLEWLMNEENERTQTPPS